MKTLLAVLCLVPMLAISGCTTGQLREQSIAEDSDPLEPMNRAIFKFNEVVDGLIIRPVTGVYRVIVPEFGRERVSSFVNNLESPVVFANALLQGNPDRAFTSFWRFILNSTFGIGGLFDFAGYYGLKNPDEDFGQTLGVWGTDSGPYLVLPILGPSSGRDLVGRVGDVLMNPITWLEDDVWSYAQAGLSGVDTRSNLWETIDDIYRNSLDPYATIRSGYLQRRQAMVENRNVKRTTP